MRRLEGLYRNRSQAGDTIVEVLIAITVVSMVLTSAYLVTNKNSQTMLAIQEKTQAQKLVERQIELLRAADSSSVNSVANPFCFTDDSGSVSSGNCTFDGTGAPASGPTDGGVRYEITIDKSQAPTYAVNAKWDRVGGGAQGNITMYYYEKK